MLSSSRSVTKCPQIRLHIQCDEFCLTGSFTCFFLALFSFLPKKNMNHKPGHVNELLQHYSVWLFGHTEMSD